MSAGRGLQIKPAVGSSSGRTREAKQALTNPFPQPSFPLDGERRGGEGAELVSGDESLDSRAVRCGACGANKEATSVQTLRTTSLPLVADGQDQRHRHFCPPPPPPRRNGSKSERLDMTSMDLEKLKMSGAGRAMAVLTSGGDAQGD